MSIVGLLCYVTLQCGQEQDLDMAGTVVSHTKNGKVYLGFLEENSKS
jgi:hypothetical protein